MNKNVFVESYLDAWNRRDASALLALMKPDAIYIDEAWQVVMTVDVLMEELQDYFDSYQYLFELSGEIFTNGENIAFRYFARPIDARSRDDSFYGADFIRLKDGLAIEIHDFYQQPEDAAIRDNSENKEQYVKSGLSESDMSDLLTKINEAMHVEHLYLDSGLSLPKLSDHLGASINHVSQAINAGLQTNFFNLVNQYRVKAAVTLLEADPALAQSTHDVASAVGFNSTSTFYSAFQRVMGKTPGAYRREVRRSS